MVLVNLLLIFPWMLMRSAKGSFTTRAPVLISGCLVSKETVVLRRWER